jgi:sulfatase maturation enzyme AslB (radical SAM superfamily)
MTCIEKIYSVSALIGEGKCNANCAFCAGKIYRANNAMNLKRDRALETAIKLCAKYGGWSLSLTGSGEPTCDPNSVTRALEIYSKCTNQGAFLPNVNLFTNGILFGDNDFCAKFLPQWRDLGLTNVAISIHSTYEDDQARAYGIKIDKYPKFKTIINNIEQYGIGVRGTLLLNKNYVGTVKKYINSVERLNDIGFKNITSWPVGNPDGSRNEFTPSRWELFKIKLWLDTHAKNCHKHSWGGGVYDYNGNILRLTDYVTKHDPGKDFVRQLVVFQDGTIAYSWIRNGALCMT